MRVTGVLNGAEFTLDSDRASEAMEGIAAEPVRDHYVVVRGRRFPPKQVLAVLLGVDRADFTTYQARRILGRLGFETGRRHTDLADASVVGVAVAPGVVSVRSAERTRDASLASVKEVEALREYRGLWVATRGDDVVVSGASPQEVLDLLERRDLTAESMFRVPLDPARDVLGG